MNNLINFDDFIEITRDKAEKLKLVEFLQQLGLVSRNFNCPKCKKEMKLSFRNDTADGCYWLCTEKTSVAKKKPQKCRSSVSIRNRTIFAQSKLKIGQILRLIFFVVDQIPVQKIERYVGVSKPTICRWAEFLRHIIFDSMMTNSEKLGGPGKIVEIDESKFGRQKYHRGHHVEGQWIFGGYEVGSGKIFLIPVPNRTESTLVPLIKEWILPGTTIRSDCWAAYRCLENEGYIHETVNHSLHFKDPNTGCHTNHIESTWRHAKQTLPGCNCRREFYAGYLAFYMFNKKVKSLRQDPFFYFCNIIKEYYARMNEENIEINTIIEEEEIASDDNE